MTQAKTLLVHGQRIAVSDEVYKAYYQCHERALAERLGVSKTTLHRRKERALSSLRARILALTD